MIDRLIKNRHLLFILALFFATRFIICIFFIDSAWVGTDSQIGMLTKEIVEGLRMPWLDYITERASPGRPLYGFLFIPFQGLMAGSILSVKVFSIVWNMIILLLWYRLLRKYFGERVAFYFGLFFIFAPSILVNENLCLWHSHLAQSGILLVIALMLFYKIFYEGSSKSLYYCLLGLIGGIGLWFDPVFLFSLPVILLFLCIKDRCFLRTRGFLLFILFLLVGILPWLFYFTTYHLSGFYVDKIPGFFNLQSMAALPQKINIFFGDFFPYLFYFNGSQEGIRWIYYGIFLAVFISLLLVNIRALKRLFFKEDKGYHGIGLRSLPPETFLLFYVLLFFIIHVLMVECITVRFFTSIYPFILAIVAIGVSRAGKFRLPFFFLLIIFLITFHALDVARRAPFFIPWAGFSYPSVENRYFIGQAMWKNRYPLERVEKQAISNDDHDMAAILYGYIESVSYPLRTYSHLVRSGALSAHERYLFRKAFNGWIYECVDHSNRQTDNIIDELINAVIISRYPALPYQAFGLSRSLLSDEGMLRLQNTLRTTRLNEEDLDIIYGGLGVIASYDDLPADRLVTQVIAAHRKSFLNGYGYGIKAPLTDFYPAVISNTNVLWNSFLDKILKMSFDRLDKSYVAEGYFTHYCIPYQIHTEKDHCLERFDWTLLLHRINTYFDSEQRSRIYAGMGAEMGRQVDSKIMIYARAKNFINNVLERDAGIEALKGFRKGLE